MLMLMFKGLTVNLEFRMLVGKLHFFGHVSISSFLDLQAHATLVIKCFNLFILSENFHKNLRELISKIIAENM